LTGVTLLPHTRCLHWRLLLLLLPAGNSSRALGGAKLTPLTTATAIANVGGHASPTKDSKPQLSPKAMPVRASDIPADELSGKSDEELRRLFKALQQEARQLKQEYEEASKSGGGGRKPSPSLIVEFAEPRHQQRPSMIAHSLEQIK
jgi:hypothetical protein